MWNACCSCCAARLPRLWREPPLPIRPAAEGLDLPLRPSPRLRRALRIALILVAMYAAELALRGHWIAAVIVSASGAGAAWVLRRHASSRTRRPLRLVLTAEGQAFLVPARGLPEPVALQPESARLGRHLLLVLRSNMRRQRVVLGPDNLDARLLAALHRRLPPAVVGEATALHSALPTGSRPPKP